MNDDVLHAKIDQLTESIENLYLVFDEVQKMELLKYIDSTTLMLNTILDKMVQHGLINNE